MRRAFTLIEMLVAVAVIALLLSIMMPAFMHIYERARRDQCRNHHHQLITACTAYSHDWKLYLPFCNSRSAEVSGWPGAGWLYDYADTQQDTVFEPQQREKGLLWPYIRQPETYRCPLEEPPYLGSNNISSYLMNRSVVAGSVAPDFRMWRSVDIIARFGADAILFWEASDSDWNDGCSYPYQGLTQRHGGGATVGCVGGHAEWITQEEYVAQQSKRPGRLYCNPGNLDGS